MTTKNKERKSTTNGNIIDETKPMKPINLNHPTFVGSKKNLLEIIQLYETRGAISSTDAHTLRLQIHDSTSGQLLAVFQRLQRLSCGWNPFQSTNSPKSFISNTNIKQQFKESTYYDILQLQQSKEITSSDIRRQFRRLALKLHPDKANTVIHHTDFNAASKQVLEQERSHDEFMQLRLAYETLMDPVRRENYDEQLRTRQHLGLEVQDSEQAIHIKFQLPPTNEFATLEWVSRVKNKLDVLEHVSIWKKLLPSELHTQEFRFETGEKCDGISCGKIVCMDKELERIGSLRRRVFICLLHRYIHACDEKCTRQNDGFDTKVCMIRAYWLVQNWIYDQLLLVPENLKVPLQKVELGSENVRFSSDAWSAECLDICTTAKSAKFQILEPGIYVCIEHGTPHVCTYEQCSQQKLQVAHARYVCNVSGIQYGFESEAVGTEVRRRRMVYRNELTNGEESIEMEVPMALPVGSSTSFLLGDSAEGQNSNVVDNANDSTIDIINDEPPLEQPTAEVSGPKARLEHHLVINKQHVNRVLSIYVKIPSALAVLPKINLELLNQELVNTGEDYDNTDNRNRAIRAKTVRSHATERSIDSVDFAPGDYILPISIHSRQNVNAIKSWIEELSEQQVSIWDQQLLWEDTIIGEEDNVQALRLEDIGIPDGGVLQLQLLDDCPLLRGTVTEAQVNQIRSGEENEYNTLAISKEAQEDLVDQYEEYVTVVQAEEEAFAEQDREQSRKELIETGVIDQTEVIEYSDGKAGHLLIGIASMDRIQNQTTLHSGDTIDKIAPSATQSRMVDETDDKIHDTKDKFDTMQKLAAEAQPLPRRNVKRIRHGSTNAPNKLRKTK